jgi:hypothetical protein
VGSDDKLLLLQIAFSLVSDAPDFQFAPLNARIEMIVRTYNQLVVLVDLKALGAVQ